MNRRLTVGLIICIFALIIFFIFLFSSQNLSQQDQNQIITINQGSFAGTLIDAQTHLPISNATINAKSSEYEYTLTTDKTGTFKFELPPANYRIIASAKAYTNNGKNDNGRMVEIRDNVHYIGALLTLNKNSVLKARVLNGSKPVSAQITIDIIADASGAQNYLAYTVSTDPDGRFIINDAPPSQANLTVSADGFAPVELNNIVFRPANTIDLGDIPLVYGTSLRGLISSNKNQKPIPNALVEIIDSTTDETVQYTRSNNKGMYKLPPTSLKNIKLKFSASEHKTIEKLLYIDGNIEQIVNTTMDPSIGITIQIRNLTNREPEETHISVHDISTNQNVYEDFSAKGTLALETLNAGPYRIELNTLDQETSTYTVAKPGDTVTLTLKPRAIIHVTILGDISNALMTYRLLADNDPKQANVQWNTIESQSFSVTDLKSGNYTLQVASNDSNPISSHTFSLTAGDEKYIKIALQQGGILTGRVLIKETLQPVSMATLRIAGTDTVVNTNEQGVFRFEGLSTDRFSIEVNTQGKTQIFSGLEIAQGRTLNRDFLISENAKDQMEGVGLQLSWKEGRIMVEGTIEGGSASQQDIQQGDLIIAIDDKPVYAQSPQDFKTFAEALRGPQGSTVKVTIERNGQKLDRLITRTAFNLQK